MCLPVIPQQSRYEHNFRGNERSRDSGE